MLSIVLMILFWSWIFDEGIIIVVGLMLANGVLFKHDVIDQIVLGCYILLCEVELVVVIWTSFFIQLPPIGVLGILYECIGDESKTKPDSAGFSSMTLHYYNCILMIDFRTWLVKNECQWEYC